MTRRWVPGEVILRREVLGLGSPAPDPDPLPHWWHRTWEAMPVFVVEDSPEQLVTYVAEGAPFGFPAGPWPTHDTLHPWHGRGHWTGHGTLMVQRPGDDHAIWHFWHGPEREFGCWYVNLQAAFRRTSIGYDTQDFELDLIVFPTGEWAFKDRELMEQRIEEGRYTRTLVDRVLAIGDELAAELDAGRRWWDDRWAAWEPDPTWVRPSLPDEWDAEPAILEPPPA